MRGRVVLEEYGAATRKRGAEIWFGSEHAHLGGGWACERRAQCAIRSHGGRPVDRNVVRSRKCRIAGECGSFHCMASHGTARAGLTGHELQGRLGGRFSSLDVARRPECLKEKSTSASNISAVVVEGFYEDPVSGV